MGENQPDVFQPDLEIMEPLKRATLQGQRLAAVIRRLASLDSPYWRAKLAAVDPDEVQGIDDIVRLPFTSKAEMRETFPFGMLAVPLEDTVRIHASSGTRGKHTMVAYTSRDIEVFAEVNARAIVCAGGGPRDVLHVAYGYGLFTGGLGLHYGGERLRGTGVAAAGGQPAPPGP